MTRLSKVAIVGGSGFIGRACVSHFRELGYHVVSIRAPRVRAQHSDLDRLAIQAERTGTATVEALMEGCDIVVNAAGVATATSGGSAELVGANTVLPAVLQAAAQRVGAQRFIHVSSAAVQGRTDMLDSSPERRPESPYSRTKADAELLLEVLAWEGAVVLRPTSVHGPDRSVTRAVTRFAASPFACVAGAGDRPTPQVHVRQVARAVEVLARETTVPRIALQPAEGFTTKSFLTLLGGRDPRQVPPGLANAAVRGSMGLGALVPGRGWAYARRLEMLLMGQRQQPGWLDKAEPTLTRPHPAWQTIHEPRR